MNINTTALKVGLILIFLVSVLAVLLFIASRQDPSLRIAALVSVTGVITGILAIASTLMIGKDVTHPTPPDVPPGSAATTTTSTTTAQTIQTPAQPVAPVLASNVIVPPAVASSLTPTAPEVKKP